MKPASALLLSPVNRPYRLTDRPDIRSSETAMNDIETHPGWDRPIDDSLAQRIRDGLPAEVATRFSEWVRPRPSAGQWRSFLSALLLAAGSLFAAAAVIFFFAANWQDLHRLSKLGILLAAFSGTGIAAWTVGLDTSVGRALQTVAWALLGTLLAVFGQVYQTGADDWRLFAWWAALSIPWTLLSRWFLPWLTNIGLLMLAALLMIEQVFAPPESVTMHLVLSAMAGAAWAGWELAARRGTARRGAPWLGKRVGPWILASLTIAPLVSPSLHVVFDRMHDPQELIALATLTLLVIFSLGFYRRWVSKEIFVPAIALAAAITVLTLLVGERLNGFNDGFSLLIIGFGLVVEISAATWWLRQMHEEAQLESKSDLDSFEEITP